MTLYVVTPEPSPSVGRPNFYRSTQLCLRGLGSRNSVSSSVCPTVRPSVRLTHACFVTNPKNLPAIFLYITKGQSFQFPGAKDLSEIPTGSPPTGAARRGGVG